LVLAIDRGCELDPNRMNQVHEFRPRTWFMRSTAFESSALAE
jgi:hypothetical protein